jgi:hypothetical protein
VPTTLLEAYFPVPMPYMPRHKEFETVVYDMLGQLCGLSAEFDFPLENPPYDHGVVRPTIELVESLSEDQTYIEHLLVPEHVWVSEREILRITAEVSISDGEHEDFENEMVVHEDGISFQVPPDTLRRLSANSVFEKRVYDLAVVANIACPGSLAFERGIVVQDGQPVLSTSKMSADSLREASNLATSIGWPTLQQLDLVKAWGWAIKQDGFLNGFANDALSRSLNAFTRLLDASIKYDPVALLWALVGIEALYTKGEESLTAQAREKIEAFLGPQTSHKKKFRQMYNFRSRFVHGDLDFPGRSSVGTADYLSDVSDAISLAVAILTATIQELVRRDWKGLSFSYTVGDLAQGKFSHTEKKAGKTET